MIGEKNRVLIVEDEPDVRSLMDLHLKRSHFETTLVDDGDTALKLLTTNKYDLVVLDWMLPTLSGLDVCKKIRENTMAKNSVIPILMVTARADTEDIVNGLNAGADDYVTKPFENSVFIARVRTLLRRASGIDPVPTVMQVGGLKLDLEKHEVHCGEEKLNLTPSEFKLMAGLMGNSGKVLSRERLIELVQGSGIVVVDRSIDTHIFGLRKKLGKCVDVIETIRGVGYRVKGQDF